MTTRLMLQLTRLEGRDPVASRTITVTTLVEDIPHEIGVEAVKAARALLRGEAPEGPVA